MDRDTLAPIAERIAPGARLVDVRPLQGGVSANVLALEVRLPDGRTESVVLRQHRSDSMEWKQLDADVTTIEFGLLSALHDAEFPVPRPRWLDRSGELLPSPFMILDFVDGTSEIAAAALPQALRQMAEFLARLHALDPASIELPTLPPRIDPVPSILEHLPPDLESLREPLTARPTPRPTSASVLHGDYWTGNILWRDERIAAVLDWEDTALGDPLSDLAGSRLELWWRHGEAAMTDYTEHYLQQTALDVADLPVWELHVATGAAAFMSRWGLAPEAEATLREKTTEFIHRAARRFRTP